MQKNIKKIVASCSLLAVIFGINVCKKQNVENASDLLIANVEALAVGETPNSVTCEEDPGDTCYVGETPVPDYDEVPQPSGCSSWFWG